MINRNSWGCLYFIVRGEILGFMKDKLMRKHSSRIFSCDKERKLEAWRWSDTVVILTVNYADQHRPSLLPIERLSEAFGLARGGRQLPPWVKKLVKLGRLEEVKVVNEIPLLLMWIDWFREFESFLVMFLVWSFFRKTINARDQVWWGVWLGRHICKTITQVS